MYSLVPQFPSLMTLLHLLLLLFFRRMFSEEEIKQMETNYDAGKEYHTYEFQVSDALRDNG